MEARLFCENHADRKKWDEFLRYHPQATSDHLWAWRSILKNAFGFQESYYLGVEIHGELRGVLPLFKIPRGFGKHALTSIPFGNYGGICADSPEVTELLLEKAKKLSGETGAKYLELRHKHPLMHEDLEPLRHTHARYVIYLQSDIDAHWKAIGQNNRSKIQRARKAGLQISISRNPELMYPIYSHTSRRQGVPCFPLSYFQSILQEFGENAKIILASYQGKPIAYYLVLYFKDSMVCQFAGALSDYYGSYPNEFLFWAALEEACQLGLKEFDFCRSRMNTGTSEFKRKLRFTEEPSEAQFYLPEKQSLVKAKGSKSKFRWMSQTWQHLPLKITESLGPVVVRYFA